MTRSISSELLLHSFPIFPEEVLYKDWKELFSIIAKVNLLFKWKKLCCVLFNFYRVAIVLCVWICSHIQIVYINKKASTSVRFDIKMFDHRSSKSIHSIWEKYFYFLYIFSRVLFRLKTEFTENQKILNK